MEQQRAFDAKQFRRALGAFATGVTIITAHSPDGCDAGVTASSFNSVSLSPPLVLWSMNKGSSTEQVFMASEHFAVHVLSGEQEALSNRFATSGIDRFAGLNVRRGVANLPMLDGCSATFTCKVVHRYEGGDHIIMVGEVLEFANTDLRPLVFEGGKYRVALTKNHDAGDSMSRYGVDWLGFLLRRSYDQVFTPLRSDIRTRGLDDVHYHVLTILAMGDCRPLNELTHLIAFTGLDARQSHFEQLVDRELLTVEERDEVAHARLTSKGCQLAMELLANGKTFESQAFRGFDHNEMTVLKSLLNRVISNTSESLPESWRKENYWLDNNVWGAPTARAASASQA